MNKQKETLQIAGMSCGHCVNAVRSALESLPGVDVHRVEIGAAEVSYDPEQTDHAHVVEAIEEEGYEVQ